MTGGATAITRTTSLAFVVLWLAAAASARAVGIWLAMGGAAIVLGGAVLVLDRAGAIALLRPSLRRVVLGAGVGGAMAAATFLLYPVLARGVPSIELDTALLQSAFRVPSAVVAWAALVPVIVGEELVWRGVVQASSVQHLGPRSGVALAALAYALAQAPLGSPVLVVVALLCGLVWGTLRAITASLVPGLVAHVAWDVLVLLWLPGAG